MAGRIHRSISEPIREGLSWEARWKAVDRGLIVNWEVGRARAESDPDAAKAAKRGELPPSIWKGGVLKPLKTNAKKYAPLAYLAEWQGLRGENLDIDPSVEVELTCTRTGVSVIYTGNYLAYANSK